MSTATTTYADELRAKIAATEAEFRSVEKDIANQHEIHDVVLRLQALHAEARANGVSVSNLADARYPSPAHQKLDELRRARRNLVEDQDQRGNDLGTFNRYPENAERAARLDAEIKQVAAEVAAFDKQTALERDAAERAAASTPEAQLAAKLDDLESKRSEAALRVLEGDTKAQADFDRIEKQIDKAKREAQLERYAIDARVKREREEAAAAAAAAERERQAQVQALAQERKAALQPVLKALGDLRATLPALVAKNRAWEALANNTSDGYRKDRTERHISDLSRTVLLDAGLNRWAVPEPPSARERMQLLTMYQIPEPSTTDATDVTKQEEQ